MQIDTERLVLRKFLAQDREAFASLNANDEVMAHFPATLTAAESHELVDKFSRAWADYKFGPFAMLHRDDQRFIGFIGLIPVSFEASFTPAIEIGWRLLPEYWRQGLTLEAALAVLEFTFDYLQLEEIVAFTAITNIPSRKLMTKLGFKRDHAHDFRHPAVPRNHRLSRHELYRMTRADWAWYTG